MRRLGLTFLRGEVLGGFFLLGLGAFILVRSLSLDYTSEIGPGPGFLPFWLGVVILGLSLLLLVTSLRRPDAPALAGTEAGVRPSRSLASWSALMIGVAMLTSLGFYATFGLLTAFLVLAMEKRSVGVALAVAAGSAFALYLIFGLALGVPLPSGPWGF